MQAAKNRKIAQIAICDYNYMKLEIRNSFFWLLALILVLGGCAPFQPRPVVFTPLEKPEAEKALSSISSSSINFPPSKFKMKISVSAIVDDKKENHTANARCLWNPREKKLRVRIYFLAVTIADLLYTGENWYITDENNSKVYICKRIDHVTIKNVPQDFLQLLEKVPESWMPENKYNISVAENENIYQLKWKQNSSNVEMLFPFESPVPSEINIESEDGTTFSSLISKPQTNFTVSSAMFSPQLEGYEVIKF